MSDPKGPKVEVPDELVAELESVSESGEPATRSMFDAPASKAPETVAPETPAGDAAREIQELRDRYLRLAAEFDNYKKRSLKERQDLFNYATEALIKDLLPTVDNLSRALGHARQGEEGVDTKALVEGVELTQRSLLQAFEKCGLRLVEAEGQPFDPQVHEAVRQIPTGEVEPGHVLEVLQVGYLLKDRLLRPALVTVSSRPKGD
jgi:molecular chaperone GrpE